MALVCLLCALSSKYAPERNKAGRGRAMRRETSIVMTMQGWRGQERREYAAFERITRTCGNLILRLISPDVVIDLFVRGGLHFAILINAEF